MSSKFDDWFVAQFGERPKSLSLDEVNSLMIKAKREMDLFVRANLWDSQRDAALKAWCANDYKASTM